MSETNEDLLLNYTNEAVTKIKIITDQVERMKIDEELYRMQMTAISIACLQNTDNSKWQRIDRASPYWSPAYQDVCSVIDREISLRQENERLKKQNEKYNEKYREALEYYQSYETWSCRLIKKQTLINKYESLTNEYVQDAEEMPAVKDCGDKAREALKDE